MSGNAPQRWGLAEAARLDGLPESFFGLLVPIFDCVVAASSAYFRQESLHWLPVPMTTASVSSPVAASSDSAPVAVQIGDQALYLADSAQFLLEYGCRIAPKGCFYIMPSCRSDVPDERHLSQFVHAEAELQGGLDDVLRLAEGHVHALAVALLDSCHDEVAAIAGGVGHLTMAAQLEQPIEQITFVTATRLVADDQGAITTLRNGSASLSPIGERALLQRVGTEFLWVSHFDRLSVPFYQACDPTDGTASCADLLLGGREVIGAGQRHATADALMRAMVEQSVDSSSYEWYIDMKARYPIQTSGYGMGLERFLMWALRVRDIRALQFFPRNEKQHGAP
jgi:aspartyl/asparaginyl-tRNA synthetase